MKETFFYFCIVSFIISSISCTNKNDTVRPDAIKTNGNLIFTTINDSTWIEQIYKKDQVEIDLINSAYHYKLKITNGGNEKYIDFDSLNIPTKTPEKVWSNKDYICIKTWSSLSFSRYIFIDIKNSYNYIYINKDIELADSISNNLVYIDTVYKKEMILRLVNLKTSAQKSIQIPIDKLNGDYPYYDNMTVKNEELLITIDGKQYKYMFVN